MGIFRRKKPKFDVDAYDSILDGVKQVYREKVRHLEEQYLTHVFHQPLLNDRDWDAKPMVLLVGQYSTGKTSFIQYLLDRDFPGMHVGPEPTTDKFQARTRSLSLSLTLSLSLSLSLTLTLTLPLTLTLTLNPTQTQP